MYARKITAAVLIAVMATMIKETASVLNTKRASQRTLRNLILISRGQGNVGLLDSLRVTGKSSFNAPMKRKAFIRRSGNIFRKRDIRGTYHPSQLKNVPPELVKKFRGQVPASVVANFNRLEMNRNTNANGNTQLKFEGRQGTIDGRSNLSPVTFGEFNYNHLINRPSACAKNADIDTSSDDDDVEKTVAVSSSPPPPPPDPNIPLTSYHKEAIISEHNEYRSNVKPRAADMRLLSWDDELQWISQTFTNSCYVRDLLETDASQSSGSQAHPTVQLRRHSYYATEIGHAWYSWPDTYDIPSDFASTAFRAWESEKRFFNRDSMECDALCEHYLQLVWAETFKIGCSIAWCSNPDINGVKWPQTLLFVCSYTPRGALSNFMAARYQASDRKHFIEPYTKGSSCSMCVIDPDNPDQDLEKMRSVTDTCWNNLCANDYRDQIIPFVAPSTTTQFSWFKPTTRSTTTTMKSPSNETAEAPIDIEVQNKDEDEIVVTGSARSETPNTAIVVLLLLAACHRIT